MAKQEPRPHQPLTIERQALLAYLLKFRPAAAVGLTGYGGRKVLNRYLNHQYPNRAPAVYLQSDGTGEIVTVTGVDPLPAWCGRFAAWLDEQGSEPVLRTHQPITAGRAVQGLLGEFWEEAR